MSYEIKLLLCPYDFIKTGIEAIYQIQQQARYAILATGARILDTKWEWKTTAENPLGEIMSTIFTVIFPFPIKGEPKLETLTYWDKYVNRGYPTVTLKFEFGP